MPGRPGRTSASTTPARSAACSSIRRTPTSSSSPRSATSTAPIPIAASTARATAARPGRRCCSRATTSARSISTSIPTHSQTIYASLWNTRRPPWSIYPPSYGPGSGLYKSTDGGANWQPLTRGLPADGVGRIGIAVAPVQRAAASTRSSTRRKAGSIRSDDAGATFAKVSGDARIWGRGWYFGKVVVDPKNADLVYVSNTGVYRSRDGGRTFGEPFKGSPGGDDYHQLWISPDDSNRMILGGDQGAVISVDGLNDHPTWSSWLNQPTAQVYRVAADNAFPVLGDRRAAGQRRGPRPLARPVRRHHDARLGAAVRRRRERLHRARSAATPTSCSAARWRSATSTPARSSASRPKSICRRRARHTWTLPLVFSPADQHALYFSDQYLFKTTDGGAHWARISDDMTRENPGVPPNLDAATAADAPAAVQAPRRHLHHRAVAGAGAAALDRHRRRLHPHHAGRRQDVDERDAAGS